MTEDEVARWHHQLDGHEFENAPRVGDGQGSLDSLLLCSPNCSTGYLSTHQNHGSTKNPKLQYFGHLMQLAHSLEKALMPG